MKSEPATTSELAELSNHKRQYRKSAESIEDRKQEAFEKCEQAGIPIPDDMEWYWTTAAEEFNSATLWKVFVLAKILSEEQPMTVRRAMYRGAGKLWDGTDDSSYNCCNNLIKKMRRKGLIPYSYIVDGTRSSLKPSSWSGLASYIDTVASSYRRNLWEQQNDYVEVFVEKDAMSGIVEPLTEEYDVRLNPIRGYASETHLEIIGQQWRRIKKPILAYYFGDFDPDGFNIEKDCRKRLEEFSGKRVNWIRLGITESDFYSGLQTVPLKQNSKKSSIWEPYKNQYGLQCVEVDALSTNEVRRRAREAIESHIDQRAWRLEQLIEEEEKIDIRNLCKKASTEG